MVEAERLETTILDTTDIDATRKIVFDNDIKDIINYAGYTNVDVVESLLK